MALVNKYKEKELPYQHLSNIGKDFLLVTKALDIALMCSSLERRAMFGE